MTLTTNEQHLVRVSTATATGNITALTKHLTAALDHGLEINKLKELLIQLYAYCGFPRSLNGLNALMSLVESRKAAGIQDEMGPEALEIPTNKSRFDLGDAVQQELTGAPVKGPLFDFAPAIDAFLKEHLFATSLRRYISTRHSDLSGTRNYYDRGISQSWCCITTKQPYTNWNEHRFNPRRDYVYRLCVGTQ